MPKLMEIPQEDIDAVLSGAVMESDVYRIIYGGCFDNMNNQAMSFESRAKSALDKGDVPTARDLIGKAYATIQEYEGSKLFIPGMTSGIRKRIGRTEQLL